MLARHGYGVLALDLRGHGESDGRSTSAPWKLDDDIDAAVEWLAARTDVDATRIGLLGVSLGGEVSLHVAARRRDVRAIVAEGVMGNGARDGNSAAAAWPVVAQLGALSIVATALTGEGPDAPDGELVERIAPRPLISSRRAGRWRRTRIARSNAAAAHRRTTGTCPTRHLHRARPASAARCPSSARRGRRPYASCSRSPTAAICDVSCAGARERRRAPAGGARAAPLGRRRTHRSAA
jgi:pimeloyl-ACP methyl ester carboxylesterase